MTEPDDIDTRKLTLGAHLEELRGHLFKAIGWLALALIVCLWPKPDVQEFLMEWVKGPHKKTIGDLQDLEITKDAREKNLPSSSADTVARVLRDEKALASALDELERNRRIYEEKTSAEPGKALTQAEARQQELIARARSLAAEQESVRARPDPARWEELEKKRVALAEEAKAASAIVRRDVAPLAQADPRYQRLELVQRNYMDIFMAYLKVSLVCALFLASPLIAWQLWKFVGAGLHRHEKRWVRIFFPVSIFAFALGAAFGYRFLIPAGLKFLASYGSSDIVGQFDLSSYVSLFINLTLVVGLIFELPLVMTFLSLVGIVRPASYGKYRRYWILAATVIAAIISPTPDPFTLLLCTAPLVVLYEVGIVLARFAASGRAPPPVDAPSPEPAAALTR